MVPKLNTSGTAVLVAFILVNFLILLVTNSRRLFLFFPIPSLDIYIHFILPPFLLFLKNSLYALNVVLFIISFLFYIMNVLANTMGRRVNHSFSQCRLNNYMALSEKIAEDRGASGLLRRFTCNPRTCANRDLGRFRCCQVLIDIDPNQARAGEKCIRSS